MSISYYIAKHQKSSRESRIPEWSMTKPSVMEGSRYG